jgi:hypothetical protein
VKFLTVTGVRYIIWCILFDWVIYIHNIVKLF